MDNNTYYKIDENSVSKRLDVYLSEVILDKTRSYIKKLIDDGKVLVNNKKVKSGYSLKLNDIISVENVEDTVLNVLPEDIKLDILYEDDDIIIVNKKKGMVVHPAVGNYTGTLVNALMNSHGENLSSINGVIRPGIVHRIDKDTSGILVVAKNDKAHKKLSDDFKIHNLKREYIALVKGIIKEDKLDINLPIGRNPKDRKKMAVTYKNSREAITHIEVLKRYYNSNLTLVKATLETGRTHQIRVHMSYIGHPLLGDEVYSKPDKNYKIKGQMLHAKTLGINHPTSNKYMEFTSDLPEEFENLLKILENKEKSI